VTIYPRLVLVSSPTGANGHPVAYFDSQRICGSVTELLYAADDFVPGEGRELAPPWRLDDAVEVVRVAVTHPDSLDPQYCSAWKRRVRNCEVANPPAAIAKYNDGTARSSNAHFSAFISEMGP
jgi:hypothetical protein